MPMTLAKEIFTGSFTSQCQVPRRLTRHRQKGFRLASDYSRSDSGHRISRDFLPGDPAVTICRNCLTSALRILLKTISSAPTRNTCLTRINSGQTGGGHLSYLQEAFVLPRGGICLTSRRHLSYPRLFVLPETFCLTPSAINRGLRSRPVITTRRP